jgi:hypothetical protein
MSIDQQQTGMGALTYISDLRMTDPACAFREPVGSNPIGF